MASNRKDPRLGLAQRELVNFSVRAQDIILKHGSTGLAALNLNGFKTTDDLGQFKVNQSMSMRDQGPTNVTTNISQEEHSKLLNMLNRSQIQEMGDQLLLPSIKTVRKGQQSPFKGGATGLFDNSYIGQKMRKTMLNEKIFDLGKSKHNNLIDEGVGALLKENTVRVNSQSVDRKNATQVKMNPKVLETWINETLQDAEHLDIPGVILKPEHKNPISRYGIDRLALTNAGIPNEMVDRIFRALFVYSVGFYELIKKCLQHTEKKYSIITAIWKVFSILLEYCCKTDYRMLISEISKEHKDELDKLEREFQAKFQEQAHNERILKQNMEILQKYNEELEKERTNERQMRLKLEEEYMQNTKNHEEEVQLRLKFESKLNNMHSVHRDLETRYKRALNELAVLQNTNEQLTNKNNSQLEEITILKTIKAENESRISYNEEKMQALQREINIKIKQVEDYEQRYTSTQDELDLTKYKLQEANKDITELKLKGDVYDSQVNGLKNEKQHLQLELKETKDLQKIYEKKCTDLMAEINKINLDYQESKREIIGFGEIQKERDERIDKLKKELRELKMIHEDLDLKHGTLSIQYEKIKEQYETCKKDLDDAIEKLHVTNKVRHETEVKLHEEVDKSKNLNEIIKDKDEVLSKRTQEIEELDKRVIDLERQNEALEIKKAGIERQYELTKKQLNEKVQNLNDVLASEKETREMWIERYEKEQKDHTSTNAQLLAAKSQLKDQVLQAKNAEIKLATQTKANEVLSESNIRLQDNYNESLARCENLERELHTQKEIMKQMDLAKKEYIQKLKRELETVESRFYQTLDQIHMVSEDYNSRAAKNFLDYQLALYKYHETKDLLEKAEETIKQRDFKIADLELTVNQLEMKVEEFLTRYYYAYDEKSQLSNLLGLIRGKVDNLETSNKHLKIEADQKIKYQNEYNELLKQHNQLKKELQKQKASSQNNQSPGIDAIVQTNIIGSQLDFPVGGDSFQSQSKQNDNNIQQRPTGVRVGGGGEIKKPPRKSNNNLVQTNQNPQLMIGGQASQMQQINTQGNQNSSLSKKNSMQSQNTLSNGTIQTPKNNLEINQGQIPTNQLPQIYPQTTTNQQKLPSLQFNSSQVNNSNQRVYDSQITSPREQNDLQVQYDNFQLSKNVNDVSSNQDHETMASKISPNHHHMLSSQIEMDGQTINTSLMQSPQGTIFNQHNQSKFMMGNSQFNAQQTSTLLENSQQFISPDNMYPNNNYQTIQSHPYLNQSQEDSSYQISSVNQNMIVAGYNNQIQMNNQNNFPQQFQQYPNDQVIMEQQYEDDEERKTPGQYSRKSGAAPNGRKSSNNSLNTFNGKKSSQKLMSNQVDYKNMNTVMSNIQAPNQPSMSNKNLSENFNGSQTNKSRYSDSNQFYQQQQIQQKASVISQPQLYNNQQQQMQQQYQQQQQYEFNQMAAQRQISGNNQNPNTNEEYEEEYDEGNENDYEEKQISRQNEESLAQDSILNQSIYQQQMINQQVINQSRMKIDISSQERRQLQLANQNPNNAAINNGYGMSSGQSPHSQVSSVYSQNMIQNKFGMQPVSHVTQNIQINQENNRKVKGKTSIRTLIKSAATRDTQ